MDSKPVANAERKTVGFSVEAVAQKDMNSRRARRSSKMSSSQDKPTIANAGRAESSLSISTNSSVSGESILYGVPGGQTQRKYTRKTSLLGLANQVIHMKRVKKKIREQFQHLSLLIASF